jgi:hypothetical protein
MNVNHAENYILTNDFISASKHYKIAFKSKFYFPVDVYNSLIVSSILKDTQYSRICINKLASLGALKDRLREKINNDLFFDNISVNYDSIRNIALNSQIVQHSKFIDDLLLMDQKCREGSNTDTYDRNLELCDDNVMERMYKFIDKYGFPSIVKVGIMSENELTGYKDHNLDLILIHQRSYKGKLFEKIAYDAVKKGEFDVRSYVRIFDYQENRLFSRIPNHSISKKEINDANSKRRKIGLYTVEDYYNRIEYHRNNLLDNKFYFVSFWDYGLNFESKLNIIE